MRYDKKNIICKTLKIKAIQNICKKIKKKFCHIINFYYFCNKKLKQNITT